jgi:hypothetical protein
MIALSFNLLFGSLFLFTFSELPPVSFYLNWGKYALLFNDPLTNFFFVFKTHTCPTLFYLLLGEILSQQNLEICYNNSEYFFNSVEIWLH